MARTVRKNKKNTSSPKYLFKQLIPIQKPIYRNTELQAVDTFRHAANKNEYKLIKNKFIALTSDTNHSFQNCFTSPIHSDYAITETIYADANSWLTRVTQTLLSPLTEIVDPQKVPNFAHI